MRINLRLHRSQLRFRVRKLQFIFLNGMFLQGVHQTLKRIDQGTDLIRFLINDTVAKLPLLIPAPAFPLLFHIIRDLPKRFYIPQNPDRCHGQKKGCHKSKKRQHGNHLACRQCIYIPCRSHLDNAPVEIPGADSGFCQQFIFLFQQNISFIRPFIPGVIFLKVFHLCVIIAGRNNHIRFIHYVYGLFRFIYNAAVLCDKMDRQINRHICDWPRIRR